MGERGHRMGDGHRRGDGERGHRRGDEGEGEQEERWGWRALKNMDNFGGHTYISLQKLGQVGTPDLKDVRPLEESDASLIQWNKTTSQYMPTFTLLHCHYTGVSIIKSLDRNFCSSPEWCDSFLWTESVSNSSRFDSMFGWNIL